MELCRSFQLDEIHQTWRAFTRIFLSANSIAICCVSACKPALAIEYVHQAIKQRVVYSIDGKLAISAPGSLDGEMHEMVGVALVRNKVEYDLFHVTSDQVTLVKNVWVFP